MSEVISIEKRSRLMLGIKGRYKSDSVLIYARLLVCLDGCFWHKCHLHYSMPKINQLFLQEKLDGKVECDIKTNRFFYEARFRILRFWDHYIDISVKSCAHHAAKLLRKTDLIPFYLI